MPKSKSSKRWVAAKKAVMRRDGYRCVYCGQYDNLTIDHIIPRSKGGTSHVTNLQTMCKRCNNAKADYIDLRRPLKAERPHLKKRTKKQGIACSPTTPPTNHRS